MKAELKWRLAVVAAVAIISIILIIPTFRYFLGVSGVIPVEPAKLEELRLKSIPLGLDLQGGVDVLLGIDESKTKAAKVEKIAENIRKAFSSESPAIDASVDMEPTGESPCIVITLNKADQERSVDNLLSTRYATQFANFKEGELKAGKATKLIVNHAELKREMTESIDSALKVIRDRVNNLGVTQPSVAKQGDSRIRVQIPGEKDPERVISTIIRPAQLEFRGLKTAEQPDANGDYHEESANYIDINTGKVLEGRSIPPGYEVRKSKTSRMNRATGKKEAIESYLLVKSRVEMRGDSIQDAWVAVNPSSMESPVEVRLTFNSDGAKRFGDITQNYLKKPLAVLLDDVVYTYPRIQTIIDQGSCVITGDFTVEEGQDIAMVLKAGALPAALEPIQKQTVEATLGADSVAASVWSLGLGALFIAVMMVLYYHAAGFIAIIALTINVLIIFAFMKLASATLTLSGIGGVLLTIGMAVDAHILIYERIREELYAKKPLKQAIALGHGRAFGVIFDGNLTTLISGLTLLQFGSGSVKGFALALNVGIIATLFTGLFCTHALVDFWFDRFKKLDIGKWQWFREGFLYDFMKLRRISYPIAICMMAFCAYVILPTSISINWGTDFTGGVLTSITTTDKLTTQQIAGEFNDLTAQKVAGENAYLLRSKFATTAEGENPIVKTQEKVKTQLDQTIGAGKYTITSSESVSNEVGTEFKGMAILSCIFACIGILIYMAFRFEFLFGFCAVAALAHDLLTTVGIFSLFGFLGWCGDLTLDVVSALLVLLGSSVNDTIVIFDRMRENKKLYPSKSNADIANASICESLNRTIMTAGTLLASLVAMLIWGGAGLFDFALVMLIGVFTGTYSSSFIAAPMYVDLAKWWAERKKKKNAKGGVKQVAPLLNNK